MTKLKNQQLSTQDLVERWQDGDKQAFGVLFTRYHNMAISIAHRYMKDRDRSKDVIQKVFLKLFQTPSLNIQSFESYVMKMVINRCLKELAKESRSSPLLQGFEPHQQKSNNIDSRLIVEDTIQNINAHLSNDEKTIFHLKLEGYSAKEIGKELNTTTNNVGVRWNRLRKKIQKIATFIF